MLRHGITHALTCRLPSLRVATPPHSPRRLQFLLWPFTQADPIATEEAMAAANPKYADWKRTYDTSRKTVTRTSYEEDFGAALSTLANQGAKFIPDAYMCPIEITLPDRVSHAPATRGCISHHAATGQGVLGSHSATTFCLCCSTEWR